MTVAIMPFGRWKGTSLAEIPNSYLHWLVQRPDLRDPLKTEIQNELQRRAGTGWQRAHAPKVNGERPNATIAQDIVRVGFRSLAKQFHPDHGGHTAVMQELNRAHEWLLEQTEALA